MDDETFARVAALEAENRELQAEVDRYRARDARGKARRRGFFSGLRFLVPIFDRYKVVRSFGKLVETVGRFSGERVQWPDREELIDDGRSFMEAVVRFLVRRRLFMLMFTILALVIPALQLYLVFQQNRIVETQNEMFEIQVYDVVASSLTEGDRNARVMTGALLARTEPGFLEGVVRETFDPSLSEVYRPEGVDAVQRRLEDAAHRGYLIRALTRAMEVRAPDTEPEELQAQLGGPVRLVLADAAARVPAVLRLGRPGATIGGELAEQVDNYLVHVGGLMANAARVARAADAEPAFWVAARPLFERLAAVSVAEDNAFAVAYRTMLEDFFIDLALEPAVGAHADLQSAGLSPEQALQRGVAKARAALPGIDLSRLAASLEVR